LQIFGIVLIMIVRAMIANLSNGYLAGNATIAAILFLGVILTGRWRAVLSTVL